MWKSRLGHPWASLKVALCPGSSSPMCCSKKQHFQFPVVLHFWLRIMSTHPINNNNSWSYFFLNWLYTWFSTEQQKALNFGANPKSKQVSKCATHLVAREMTWPVVMSRTRKSRRIPFFPSAATHESISTTSPLQELPLPTSWKLVWPHWCIWRWQVIENWEICRHLSICNKCVLAKHSFSLQHHIHTIYVNSWWMAQETSAVCQEITKQGSDWLQRAFE